MSVMVVLLCIGSVAAFAQKNVRGSVSDEKGEPLAGVSVLTEYNGKKTGTVTDANGNRSLTVQNGADVEFSFIGFQSETLAADKDVINVVEGKIVSSEGFLRNLIFKPGKLK